MVDLNKSIDPRERAKERARAEREAFKEALSDQCYLVGRIEELSKFNSRMHASGHPAYKFKTFSCLDDPNPAGTISSFYHFHNMHELYNITPAEYAHLVPLLELAIVHRSPATRMEVARTDVPLQGTFIDPRELLKNPGSRSQSLGLKSFSFELNGSDPYTAKKLIKATAVFHADSLVVFNKNHYMKILSILDKKGNRLEHRYKVGWAIPENFPNKNLANILRDAHMELVCNYVHHTFDIGQDGTFTLTIEYVAAIDMALNRCDLLEHATKLNDKKAREETTVSSKFNKFLRAKSTGTTQKAILDEIAHATTQLKETKAQQEREQYELEAVEAIMNTAVENENMRSVPQSTIDRYGYLFKRVAPGREGFYVVGGDAYSSKIASLETRIEELKVQADSGLTDAVNARMEGLDFLVSDELINEFLANFPEQQKRKFKPVLREMAQKYNTTKETAFRDQISADFNPFHNHTATGNANNTLAKNDFKNFVKAYRTKQMKRRNDDVFKMFVDKLESDKSETKIHNLLVTPGQFLGQLQKYQSDDFAQGAQRSKTQDVEPELLQSSTDAPESAEPNFSDPDVTPDAPPPKEETAESATNALMDGDSQNSDEIVGSLDFLPEEQGKKAIQFFYFGDLFDILVEATNAQVSDKKLNFILGTMPYISPGDRTRKIVSLADIPISYVAFKAWIHRNYIQKYTGLKLPLVNFISNLFSQLIRPAFSGECFESLGVVGGNTNRVTMHHKTLTSEVPTGRIALQTMKRITSNRGTDVECILFAANMDPALATGGSYEKDIEKGIFHFHLGRDRGLLKKATFAKYDIPELKAHRMTMDNASDMDRIKEPYKCDLDLVGNNLLYPGVDFFVTPSVPGGESELVAMKLGVGGYYKALVVEHNISPNGYVTRVKGSIGTETQSSTKKPKPDAVTFASKNSLEGLSNQAIKEAENANKGIKDDIEQKVKQAEAEGTKKHLAAEAERQEAREEEIDRTFAEAEAALDLLAAAGED